MKTMQRILMGIAALIIILVGVAYLLPSAWQVDRSIEIHASPEAIDPYVANLRRWNEWIPWTKALDPTVRHTFEGPEFGVGQTMIWDGDKMGHGNIAVTQFVPEQGIEYAMSFGEGKMPSVGAIRYTLQADNTLVRWTDKGELGNNPVNRYMGLFMSALLKEDFEKGLAKLKQKVESSANVP